MNKRTTSAAMSASTAPGAAVPAASSGHSSSQICAASQRLRCTPGATAPRLGEVVCQLRARHAVFARVRRNQHTLCAVRKRRAAASAALQLESARVDTYRSARTHHVAGFLAAAVAAAAVALARICHGLRSASFLTAESRALCYGPLRRRSCSARTRSHAGPLPNASSEQRLQARDETRRCPR